MAHRFGPILHGFSTKSSSFGQHFKTISLTCSGSNQKVRNWSKILGFSTPLAILGIGIKTFNDAEEVWWNKGCFPSRFNSFYARTNLLKSASLRFNSDFGNFYSSLKKIKDDVSASSRSLLNFISLITPASCACAVATDNSACVCISKPTCELSPCPMNKPDKPPLPTTCNCPDCKDKKENCASCRKNASAPQCPQKPPAAPPLVPKSGTCHSSGSGCGARQHCSEPSDLDMSTLSAQLGNLKQVDWAEESDLSHCRLIKQASQITVDSATRIITEIASAYEDYNVEFRKVLDIMMDTLEESRTACGAELEILEVKLVIIRSKIDEWKKKIKELDMFLCSVEKLANATAETAFMAHAEYASIAMSERIQSLEREIKCIRDETRERERDMLQLQSLIIVESGKGLK